MSEVRTRKSEALALLALEETTIEQDKRIDYLTAQASGLPTEYVYEYNSNRDRYDLVGGDEPMHYTYDVDACLTLKLPDRCIWKLYHGDDRGASATIVFRPAGQPALDWGFGRAGTLQLAILKAWWSLQV